jgi:glycosyltransferase involved in cell wall biosynthesis
VRILTVGNMYPPHHFGGYELVWRSAVEHLRERGYQVRVLTTDTDTGAPGADPEYVYRELRWPLRNARFEHLGLRARIALARHNHRTLQTHLDDHGPDVVGWWSMGGLTLTMLEAVRRQEIPAVAFVHDDWLDYGRWADAWLHMFRGRRRAVAPLVEQAVGIPARVDFSSAASYVFVSDHTRQHALRTTGPFIKTGVSHSGIHPDFLRPAEPHPWGWRLLCVGRLDPRKGVDTAVRALSGLPEEASLELIGGWDTQEEDRLKRLATSCGVGSRVRFLGQLDRAEIAVAYERADVVVFPVSWEEPWGLVPLEAMAKGRPVIATGRGGSSEYLRHQENCLIFEAEDDEALAAALKRLAADTVLRARIREEGLSTAPLHTEPVFNRAVENALHDASRSQQPGVAPWAVA